MIYLYAVSALAPQGFRGLGLEEAPVVSLAHAGVHLAHSFHRDDFEPPVTAEALWAHEAIVDELLATGPVVPFRFGTTLPDRAAAEAYLTREAERFKRTLAELQGRVELAVRVVLPEAKREEEPADGTAYLAARARTRDALAGLLAPLEPLAADIKHRDGGPAEVVRASYLVARDDVDQFAAAVRGLQENHPDVALSCTGPWAPYSFVGERR
jgi:Gas vesicle synthesis protein GvpL/GvpF